jgi:glycosyltransferase involved in cell wall biosynthesis
MNILIISEFFPHSEHCEIRGGVEARAFYVAKELAKKHKVTVITSLEKGLKKEQGFSGINVIRVGIPRAYTQQGSFIERIAFVRDAMKHGLDVEADIVDGYNFISYLAAYKIARKKKIKSIATYHDVWLRQWIKNVGLLSGLAGEIIERYVLSRKWDRFIAVSNYTRQKLINSGVKKERIAVVHNGIDLEEIGKIRTIKYAAPTICCVSRLVKYKKVDTLIKAVALVKEKIPKIQCNIIGTGPEKKSLNNLIGCLKLEKNAHLLGFIPKHRDVLKEIKKSQVFCLPSSVEGFGMTVIEALACGVPCVISDIPPLLEITEGGRGCAIFRAGNHEELAESIMSLINAREKKDMGFLKKYDWKKIAKNVEKAYLK